MNLRTNHIAITEVPKLLYTQPGDSVHQHPSSCEENHTETPRSASESTTILLGTDQSSISIMGGSLVTVYGLVLTCQVRAIGMGSPELLQLVEGCPPGGETLVMRMLHILTESGKYQ